MKKKLITTLAGFAFALCCVFLSCNKNQCEPCGSNYKTIPQEMRDWALFGEGSWWVYRLAEDTTVFDTVRFSSRSDFRSNLYTCDDYYAPSIGCSETITCHWRHSNSYYFNGVDQIVLFYPPGGGVFLYFSGSGYGGGNIFGINPIKVDEFYGNFRLIDTFSNQNFNGIKINKGFYSSTLADTSTTVKYVRDIYWGKNIGLVKVQIYPNSQTWELINYEVKQ
ncbi:MAG: hypothetical protein Q8K70_02975 [Bacteroidota bacterium]|nr:hypothetical protein [Bacteroidota bacterium]